MSVSTAAAQAAAQAAFRKSTIESWTLYSIGLASTILRTYARIRTMGIANLQAADYLVWVGAIFYTAQTALAYNIGNAAHGLANNGMTHAQRVALSTDDPEFGFRVVGSKIQIAGWTTYSALMWSLKLSMLAFYIQLTDGLSQRYRIRIHIGFGLVISTFFACLLTIMLACRPFYHYWQINPDPGNACQAAISKPIIWVSFAANVTTDIYLILIPLPMLWSSRLKLVKKIASSFILGSGIFVLICALLKSIFVLVDPVNGGQLAGEWGTREAFVMVITTNLPMIFPLFKLWLRPLLGSVLSSSHKTHNVPTGFRTIGGGGGGESSRNRRRTPSANTVSIDLVTFNESKERIVVDVETQGRKTSAVPASDNYPPDGIMVSNQVDVTHEDGMIGNSKLLQRVPESCREGEEMDQSPERTGVSDSSPHTAESSPSIPNEEKKRTRIQLSCTLCRYRKLKCDRALPCTNCVKRRQASSCRYVGPPRLHGRPDPNHSESGSLQARLDHLENLVHSFIKSKATGQGTTQSGQTGNEPSATSEGSQELEHHDRVNSESTDEEETSIDSQGRIMVDNVGTSYIDAAHWKAILEDGFEEDSMTLEVDANEDLLESPEPFLLLGAASSITKEELLACVPSRSVVDALVSRYFNSKDHSIFIMHTPTFQKEYTEFWHNPQSVSVSWLGLLFTILALSVHIYNRVEDPLPPPLRGIPDAMDIFRKRAAQCLLYANYMNPGPYNMEALIQYLITEHLRSNDAQIGVSVLLGIIIKLAMSMGYHRDPKHYPNISAFEGEMRRRAWVLICQLEHLISFQVGLPRVIQDWQCDTKPPHNLLDEDFDSSTVHLPPSRPVTDRTPASYMIAKSKVNYIFGKITDMLSSRKHSSYEDVMKLDKSLREAHAALPPFLRMRSMDLLITDPPDLVMQRYTLELLYQKTRCVLHRKYLTKVRSNLRYTYSRWASVNAAREILQHQADINRETQQGGQLYRDRWFIGSLQYHDFLLAAMIICLELSQTPERRSQTQSRQVNEGFTVTFEGREELYKALETSYQIWTVYQKGSADAHKAAKVLAVILQKVRKSHPDIQQAEESILVEAGKGENVTLETSGVQNITPMSQFSRDTNQLQTILPGDPSSMLVQQEYPSSTQAEWLGNIQGMVDVPQEFDWQLWDDQMRIDNLDQL
ncbi:hypothetical protein B7463_g6786, partial [Scytalidium lignicola]